VSAPADAGRGAGRRRGKPLGRRGLVIGVVLLVVIAAVGGTALLRAGGRTAAGVSAALAPFPGFPPATPVREAIGASPDPRGAYAAIAAQGTADWRAQFARGGVDWARPSWPVRPAAPAGGDRRARDVLDVGMRLGDWAQQLVGIPGLLEVARRQGRMTAAAVRSGSVDLVACLAGAWGRSMIAAGELGAIAPADVSSWVARGAASGVPSSCAAAVGA
jgi:predicted metalloprotease